MISREDVANKKFNVVKKGYDMQQVDAVLDEIVRTLGEYERDAQELERFRGLEKQLSSALIAAQGTAAGIKEKAEAEAEEKLTSAEEQAARILEEAQKQRDEQLGSLEEETSDAVEKIKKLKEFVETYKQCILMDMDNHREAFVQGFLSEATYDEIADELPEEPVEEAEEEEAQAEESASQEQLDTGEMESIDLAEIVNNLPNADDELKALINDIL